MRTAIRTNGTALLRWLGFNPGDDVDPPFDEPPPRRGNYPLGNSGRLQYHAARAEWFRNITRSAEHPEGRSLDGSLADQNALFDSIARRYRQYSDR